MPHIDIDALLSDISPDAPCGPDPEDDTEFLAIERDAQGTPARYTPSGNLEAEAEDPNWGEIKSRCVALFDRVIDLRIGVILTNALMCQHGLTGLRDGLRLIKEINERHWDHYHPQLDSFDDFDPLMRMNIVASFAAPIGADGDPHRFQRRLRDIPLAESRQLGRFGLREMLIAAGDLSAPKGTPDINDALIDAAFKDTDGDALKASAEAAGECITISKAIDQWLTAKVGATNACDLDPWHAALAELDKRLKPRVAIRFPETAPAAQADGGQAGEAQPGTGAQQAGQAALSGEVRTRDDVVRALDKVLEYFARHEPSSPVPLLVRRAQSLVNRGFVDIIRDLSPQSLEQLKVIGGADALNEPTMVLPQPVPADNAPASGASAPSSAPSQPPAQPPSQSPAPTPPPASRDFGPAQKLDPNQWL